MIHAVTRRLKKLPFEKQFVGRDQQAVTPLSSTISFFWGISW
jgi:hypothetical protein